MEGSIRQTRPPSTLCEDLRSANRSNLRHRSLSSRKLITTMDIIHELSISLRVAVLSKCRQLRQLAKINPLLLKVHTTGGVNLPHKSLLAALHTLTTKVWAAAISTCPNLQVNNTTIIKLPKLMVSTFQLLLPRKGCPITHRSHH